MKKFRDTFSKENERYNYVVWTFHWDKRSEK